MGVYSLESAIEATRLEEQALSQNYSIESEFQTLTFKKNEVVMDAGCGTGILSRYLVERFNLKHIDALDYSELRLKQASQLLQGPAKSAIHFHQQNLNSLDSKFHNKYDTVIARYVIEHMEDPIQGLRELYKAIKKNGRMIVVETDGVFINLYSENSLFNRYMDELKSKMRFDLNIGKKVPNYLKRIGLTDITWEAKIMSFHGENLQEEISNTKKRFVALKDYFFSIFDSNERCQEFEKLYLEEMSKPENTLVFSKFICLGKKT